MTATATGTATRPDGASPPGPRSDATRGARAGALEIAWAGTLTWVLGVAASLGFLQVFRTGEWIPPVTMGVTVAAGAVVVGRAVGLRTPLNAAFAGLAAATWVTWWWPLGRGLPWADKPAALMAGRDLASVAIAEQVTPAEAVPGLVLAVTVGVTLVTLLVGLALQARRPGLAAVLALALWAGPAAVEVPAPAGPIAAVGILLAAGIALATIHRSPPHLAVGDLGRGLTVTAVAVLVGVVAAPLTPWYGEHALLDVRTLGVRGAASQPIVDVGDQLRLPAPRQVAVVRTTSPTYLRTAALDVFDGTTWRAGTSPNQTWDPRTGSESAQGPLIRSTAPDAVTSRWDVTTYNLPAVWLPIPNQPQRVVPIADDQRITFNRVGEVAFVEDVAALEASTEVGPDYVVTATVPTPTVAALRTAGPAQRMEEATLLPVGLHDDLLVTADRVVTDAGATTAIDRTLALVDWFSGPESTFSYSTDVPGLRGADALSDFVHGTQVGYCEYYATALAVMLRGLGIPARVATGYLPGSEITPATDGGQGVYSVATTDAHAWVEVAFEDWGWVTFDATPRNDTGGLRPGGDALVPFGTNGVPGEVPAAPPSEDVGRPDQPPEVAPATPAPTGVPEPGVGSASGGNGSGPTLLVAAAGVVLAGALLVRRRMAIDLTAPAAAQVEARLGRLFDAARRLELPRSPAETLHEVMLRWREELDLDGRATRVVTTVATSALHTARTPSRDDLAELALATRALRAGLRRSASRWRRLLDRGIEWFEGR